MAPSKRPVYRYPLPEIGNRFGDLIVTAFATRKPLEPQRLVCLCDCGTEFYPLWSNVRNGKTQRCRECGSRRAWEKRVVYDTIPREHRRHLHAIIGGVFRRCYDPDHNGYNAYGGRGISVFPAWIGNKKVFMEYLVTIPGWDEKSLTLDRIDVNGHYEPGNLRFVPSQKQNHNKQKTKWVQYKGERMSATEFWRTHCPKYRVLSSVLKKLAQGRTPERIVADQVNCRGPYLRHSERGAA